MQRCRCIVFDQGTGVCEVFLAADLPERLARAELAAYLSMWEGGFLLADASALRSER